jgi:succinyl-diaminopimelate desuccinylase
MTNLYSEGVELTRELVRLPSENPPATEQRVGEFVAQWLRRVPGVEVEVFEVQPGRSNVVGRLRSGSSAPAVAILAHMDTVPVGDGWSKDPFGGEIEHGRLYGRGSCDMKAGLACAMVALKRAAAQKSSPRRDILVCATVDEEGSHMLGGMDLIRHGIVDKDSFVVATEPTSLEIIIAHKGLVWLEVEAIGKLAHAGNPALGVDAVRAMSAFVMEFHAQIMALPHQHDRLGRTTATFSKIEGGIKTNVVPDRARLEIDVRIPPPMSIADVHVLAGVAAERAQQLVPGARLSFRQLNNERPPVEADEQGEFVRALSGAFRETTARPAVLTGFPAYTDASVIQARTGNRQSLVFGPGALAQAHTVDEYVPIDEIDACTDILTRSLAKLCFA